MDKREVKIDYTVYENSCPSAYEAICRKAVEVIPNAYSIYSGFSVGAAVLLENGEIVAGTNQENAAYPSGLCAERTALFYAQSVYPGVKVKALAIAAFNKGIQTEDVVTPCGACRQVMAEVVKRYGDFEVIMIGRNRSVCLKASDLLPFAFTLL
ncbi:cytidine deaminase [uncultured Culturomica sp.]|uniref:cytidine deaminase n=1 Tax=uncultured Culturomica sp. TaxID=1926654 RepID=UPI000339A6E9|nr:cytidine deaminase [uncultured Culturomica sp.]CCZ09924.1 cytidine deaminase [Odoribacter sp. CAG:788]